MICYSAAIPPLAWAIAILCGADANSTRVVFLVVWSIAIILSIRGLREKYRDNDGL